MAFERTTNGSEEMTVSNVNARTERLNMRISPDALVTLRAAAASLQQDVSSFVLGTAVAKAREVLKDDATIYLSKRDWDFMEDYLTNDHEIPQGLRDLFARTEDAFRALPKAAEDSSKASE